jgi:glutathione S-transferase
VARGLAHAQATLPDGDASVDIGDVALACALGYLDLRFAGAWRVEHPRLVAWLDAFAARVPAFEETRPPA